MFKKKIVWAVLTLSLLGGGYWWYGTYKSGEKEKMPQKIYTVKRISIKNSVDATGVVKPSVGAEITVGARVSGSVIQQNVKVGDAVKKGDLIAVIDPRAPQEELKMAQAELSEIKANYPGRIDIEKAKLQSTQKSFELATWGFDKRKKLFETQRKFITEEEYKKAKNEAEIAQIALENQKMTLANLEREYSSRLKSAQARLNTTQISLSYTRIYAPIEGLISFVSTQEGETVVAGMNAPQFVKILDPKRLENRVFVDETQIGKIKIGMSCEFIVDTYKERKFKGEVIQIYPTPTLQNNIVYFTVVVGKFDGVMALKPEMTTHNKIVLEVQDSVLAIPNSCVKWKNGKFIALKKLAERIVEVPIKIGISDDKNTVVTDGLADGDTVVETATLSEKKNGGVKH